MTISTQTTDLCGSKTGALTTKRRRQAGTSLVEILVVIVIFLIGILAVIQVFPGGFRLLLNTRSNTVATQIGRDEIERIKANPDLLPDDVLAVRYSGNAAQVDPTIDPLGVGPAGDTISSAGILTNGGSGGRDWLLASGPNLARRIIGEGQRVPGPRQVGNYFGGLMVLDHGPIDPGSDANNPGIVAYANDLSPTLGEPRDMTTSVPSSGWNVSVPGGSTVANTQWVQTPVSIVPYEFFVTSPATTDAAVLLPTSKFDRTYRIRVSGTVLAGGVYGRSEYVSLSIFVPALADLDRIANPLVRVSLNNVLVATTNALPPGGSLVSVDSDAVRVAPRYVPIAVGTAWTPDDPFQVKILDRNLGVLLFAPAARDGVVSRPGGTSEPLLAKVDYDVLDWRILHDDFRMNEFGSMQLALQSLKVGTATGPDGRANGVIPDLESGVSSTDNVVIVDVTTGGIVRETPGVVRVDKSRGTVSILDKVTIDIPAGRPTFTTITNVSMVNRPIRVLYRARNEWAVQLIKGASQYPVLYELPQGNNFYGGCYVGGAASGGLRTHLYFPKSAVNRKVTIDKIAYFNGTVPGVLEGQDFVIRPPAANDPIQLPSISLNDVVAADRFAGFYDRELPPVSGVKGASLAVRVLWNPDAFTLTTDTDTNLARAEIYGRGWHKSLTETYLRVEETR